MVPLKPYLNLIRFHQPVGTLLVLWPPLWTLMLLHNGLPSASILIAFILGAFLMRSAGCIINDLTDRKLDANIERTRLRPLASGEISIRHALILLSALLFCAALIALFLGKNVFLYSLLVLPLIILYPWMKRITFWPQLFLGITFNYGIILASVALYGSVHAAAILIYLGSIFWTLGYDTIYGFQDIKDDEKIGIKSTSRLFGSRARPILSLIYMGAILCWGMVIYTLALPLIYFLGLYAIVCHFTSQIYALKTDEPMICRKLFLSNAVLGGMIFFSLLLR